MADSFKSDNNIFNNRITFLIGLRAKPEIFKIIKEKHINEKYDEISIQDKKNDLIIWNALYTTEVVKNGILKQYLHPIYNKFYDLIAKKKTIEDPKFFVLMLHTLAYNQ